MIADEIYPLMESGWAEPVSAIRRFTGPRSVEMVDGRVIEDVDAVIHCTGYTAQVPFLKGDLNPYPVSGQQGNFYRNIFLLHNDPAVRDSIAFVGHGGVTWPGFAAFEMQSMAVSQVWQGKSQLPSYEEQKQWLEKLKKDRVAMLAKSPYESTHYPAILPLTDHMRFIEETAGTDVFSHFGWGWKAWKFWWEDRKFYNLCSSGLFSPALWRYFETGKRKAWPGAKEQIYKHNEELKVSIERRKAYMKSLENKKAV
jgi:dimethylaniline monooxygenase (N-oxide forming)